MNKRILLLGFTFALLLAIPVALWALSQQYNKPIKAVKSSNLTFSQLSGPVTAGQKFNLDIILDPGQNQISFVKMVISYNPQFLSVANGGGFVSVATNQYSNQFTQTLDGPTYDETSNKCVGTTCNMTISFGLNPAKDQPLSGAPATIASIGFTAVASANGSTTVSFSAGTQVLSLAPSDQPSENVANWQSTTIQITGPTPTNSPAPTGGGGGGGGGGNPTDTPAPTNSPAPTGGGGGGGGGGGATGPICNSLTGDKTSAATAPLAVLFTVTGNDAATTITKATLNFGDGNVQDITTGGGLGSANVNAQINHTYQQTGTFTATATMTDANGNVSAPSSCSQVITIGSTQNPTGTSAPQPTSGQLMKTGPGDVFVGVGIVGAILGIAGVALLVGVL